MKNCHCAVRLALFVVLNSDYTFALILHSDRSPNDTQPFDVQEFLTRAGSDVLSAVPSIITQMAGFRNLSNLHHLSSIQDGVDSEKESLSVSFSVLKDPWYSGNTGVHLVTVETRRKVRPHIPHIDNIGQGKQFEGYITKLKVTYEWLKRQSGDPLVIFVDGSDTLFGGCTEEQFMQDYRDLQRREGGRDIVVAAERGCYEIPAPWKCSDMPEAPRWARRDWAEAAGGIVLESSPVDPQGQPRYVNSGFVMGPRKKLMDFYKNTLLAMEAAAKTNGDAKSDQYYVTQQFLEHPQEATLDYASSLVTCGYSLDLQKLFALQENADFFHKLLGKTKRNVYNIVTGKRQCFFHANGPAKRQGGDLTSWLEGGNKPW